MGDVVITGIGIITPLGAQPQQILSVIRQGAMAAVAPTRWTADSFPCPVCAPVTEFDPEPFVPESKTIRFMNRDALLAVAAARLALGDAAIEIGRHCPPEDVGLYGATGLAGIELAEVSRLIQLAADGQGGLDLHRFGAVALKQVRPVLSFKILSNMPMCFVSIFEQIQGPNTIYNPWEGQGAQAIASAAAAIRRGEAVCALAGGCDVKTHELAFLALARLGVFRSWERQGNGCVPGEGAAFLVLENEGHARERGGRIYARIRKIACRTVESEKGRAETYAAILHSSGVSSATAVVRAGDGDGGLDNAELESLRRTGLDRAPAIRPKAHLGNLFAAAAAVQVGLAAAWASGMQRGDTVLANCFGYGSEQAAFVLESP